MPNGIYLAISNVVQKTFDEGWSHSDVPVLWRKNDLVPRPDPNGTLHFFRNEVLFGAERIMAFGGGLGRNLRAQFGSVRIVGFSARFVASEDILLNLLGDATAAFRSRRTTDELGNNISFIGAGAGGDLTPTEDGNWFYRGAIAVFEYRFTG